MKIYQSNSKNRTQRKKRQLFVIFIVTAIFLVVINISNSFLPKGVIRAIVTPVMPLQLMFVEKSDQVSNFFLEKELLRTRLSESKEENIALRNEKLLLLALLDDAGKEYTEESFTITGDVEKVLVRPPFTPYDTLLVAKKHNYEIGADVFARGVLVGVIKEITGDIAQVELFSQSGNKTTARVGDIDIEVDGIGGGGLRASVPKDYSIPSGTPVIKDIGETVVVVGVVVERDVDENSSFAELYISSTASLQSLRYVTIVSK